MKKKKIKASDQSSPAKKNVGKQPATIGTGSGIPEVFRVDYPSWEGQEDLSVRGRGEWKEHSDASTRGAGNLEDHDLPSRRGEGGWDGFTR